jgi:hypothetical protein
MLLNFLAVQQDSGSSGSGRQQRGGHVARAMDSLFIAPVAQLQSLAVSEPWHLSCSFMYVGARFCA